MQGTEFLFNRLISKIGIGILLLASLSTQGEAAGPNQNDGVVIPPAGSPVSPQQLHDPAPATVAPLINISASSPLGVSNASVSESNSQVSLFGFPYGPYVQGSPGVNLNVSMPVHIQASMSYYVGCGYIAIPDGDVSFTDTYDPVCYSGTLPPPGTICTNTVDTTVSKPPLWGSSYVAVEDYPWSSAILASLSPFAILSPDQIAAYQAYCDGKTIVSYHCCPVRGATGVGRAEAVVGVA